MLIYLELFNVCRLIIIKKYGYCFFGINLKSPFTKPSNSAFATVQQLRIFGFPFFEYTSVSSAKRLIDRNVISVNKVQSQ